VWKSKASISLISILPFYSLHGAGQQEWGDETSVLSPLLHVSFSVQNTARMLVEGRTESRTQKDYQHNTPHLLPPTPFQTKTMLSPASNNTHKAKKKKTTLAKKT
jgi:hypothetical protein